MPWSPRHNHLRFAVQHEDERVTVLLAGELDCASATVAHLALERAGPGTAEIALDLSRVVFLDAAGLRFLISAQRRARAAHRQLIVLRPSRSVRRVIELTGVRPLLSVEDPEPGRLPDDPDRSVADLLDAAIESAMRIADADMASAQLIDRPTGAVRTVAERGFSSLLPDYFEATSDADASYRTTLCSGQSVWIPDLARSSILLDSPALDLLLDARVRAIASVPVDAPDGQLLAVLSVYQRLVTYWPDEQKARLEHLGRSLAEQWRIACGTEPEQTGRPADQPGPRSRNG